MKARGAQGSEKSAAPPPTTPASPPSTQRWWYVPLAAALSSLVVAVVTLIGTALHQRWSNEPAIKGRIVTTAIGEIMIGKGRHRTITMYVVLANPKDVPVTPIDFRLVANIKGRREPLQMALSHQRTDEVVLTFDDGASPGLMPGQSLTIPSSALLVNHINKPVTREKTVGGLLFFLAPGSIPKDAIGSVSLEVLDAFGGAHAVKSDLSVHDARLMMRLDPSIRLSP